MINKLWIFVGIKLVLLIVVGIIYGPSLLEGNPSENITGKATDSELVQYRSEDIPSDCRLPEYENNVESWKEHLEHHQNTLYCLEYYK